MFLFPPLITLQIWNGLVSMKFVCFFQLLWKIQFWALCILRMVELLIELYIHETSSYERCNSQNTIQTVPKNFLGSWRILESKSEYMFHEGRKQNKEMCQACVCWVLSFRYIYSGSLSLASSMHLQYEFCQAWLHNSYFCYIIISSS